MSETAGITIAVPQELFARLIAEARAQDRALSAHASDLFVAAMLGRSIATITSPRELDLARQLKEMTAKAAEAKNAVAAAVTARRALEQRVTALAEKNAAAPARADDAEIAELKRALQAEQAETEAQRRLADDMMRERDAWRSRASDKIAIIARLEAEVQKRTTAPAPAAPAVLVEKTDRAPLAPAQIRAIRCFASLGHRADWISRQTDLPVEAVKEVLRGVSMAGKRSVK